MKASPKTPARPNGRSQEVAALLAAARAVLENHAFSDAAQAILAACRTILGAQGGLVAVCPQGGGEFEVALLDPCRIELDAVAGWPAPLRRLSNHARKIGCAAFANDLLKSKVSKTAAKGSSPGLGATVENALYAPITITGEVVGLLGLLDKPGGFRAADAQLAEVFAEMAAVAMLKSRTVNGFEKNRLDLEREVREGATQLHQAEEQFRTLVENLPDMVARFGPDLRYLYASRAVEGVTGLQARDYVGKTNQELGMAAELVGAWETALRQVFVTGQPARLEFAYPATAGARHFDCRLVPEPGPDGSIPSVLSVARDVTDKWLAHEAEQHARTIAEAMREATVALTRSLDRETVLVTLLDHLRQMVPFDRASVMLIEEALRVSIRAVFDGDRVAILPAAERPELDSREHPIVHDILTTGTAVLIPDVRARSDWSLPTDHSSEASWMGVPLFARGNVAGFFALSKREPAYFNEEHVRLAEAMSSQASVAVENAILFEQMQASTVRMQSLSRRLVEVQETERRHIARELHDEAGQALTSLRYGLRLLEREIDEGSKVTGRMAELMQRTDAVIDSLHRLAVDLRPASLDHLGLEAALRQYARSTSKLGLAVRFKARGFTSERLPAGVETSLYRVVQEAMTNIVRHAQATRVDLLAQRRGDRVMVMIEDDGIGFEPSQVQGGHHFGLLGLRERAEALGGTLTVESAPGAGTTIVVEVSCANPHPDR